MIILWVISLRQWVQITMPTDNLRKNTEKELTNKIIKNMHADGNWAEISPKVTAVEHYFVCYVISQNFLKKTSSSLKLLLSRCVWSASPNNQNKIQEIMEFGRKLIYRNVVEIEFLSHMRFKTNFNVQRSCNRNITVITLRSDTAYYSTIPIAIAVDQIGNSLFYVYVCTNTQFYRQHCFHIYSIIPWMCGKYFKRRNK